MMRSSRARVIHRAFAYQKRCWMMVAAACIVAVGGCGCSCVFIKVFFFVFFVVSRIDVIDSWVSVLVGGVYKSMGAACSNGFEYQQQQQQQQ